MRDRQLHRCEHHGDVFVHASKLKPPRTRTQTKPRKPLKRTRRRETAVEKRARLHFNKTVKSWPCWFRKHRPCERCGGTGETKLAGDLTWTCTECNGDGRHRCTKPKDAHHLLPQRFTRRMFHAVLPEAEFVAILHNPKIGAPLCRKAHDLIEAKQDRIYWEDLSEECIEYVGSLPDFCLIELERLHPKRPPQQEAVSASDRSLN